ncbi:MAG: glycosyltransferase family 4 protein [Burkholderiales bacterium]|nr:glycosyltransferase family 4 protein [Burkholderiales bacterium]
MASRLRRALTDATPLPILVLAWRVYNRITFNALSHDEQPVQFRHGDIVLLCDACWNYRVSLAVRAAREAGARVVVMVHDLIPLRQPEFSAPLLTSIFGQWLAEMIDSADAIVCNSAATMSEVQRFAAERGWNVPPLGYFRLGSDVPGRADATSVRQELVEITAKGTACFAAVGSIELRKNYRMLMSAFDQLWSQGHDVRLVIAGRPTPECRDLVDAITSHPERGGRFLPMFDATDAELNHLYSACRALVFPSLAEGFGLPLVEARTRGALVIASDIPVFRELADDGVLLFDRFSLPALVNRLLDVARTDRGASVAPMRPFTWGDSARQLVAVTNRLIASAE